ncbi:MAG: flagellar assembly protein FliH [Burkholderiaceae bacterium]|nr:flagellar assembly protein FliH [Burkholderiaceae bacterium]
MNTSSKHLADNLKGHHWAPLEMTSFDAPVAANTATAPDVAVSPPPPTAAELRRQIQALRATAQTRGQAEGYAAGHAQGLATGLQEGQEQGHAQGYEAGLAQGHKAGSEQARQACNQLLTLADECAASIASLEADMGQSLISLAIRIAEQVLRSTLDSQPEKLLDLIHDITHQDNDQDAMLKLRLHPDDLELVRRYLDKEPGVGLWRLLADPTVTRGGCIAETSQGDIDATLETRWQRVIAALGHKAALGQDA